MRICYLRLPRDATTRIRPPDGVLFPRCIRERIAQQSFKVPCRNRVRYATRFGQCGLLGTLDERHVDDAEHLSCGRVVDGTAAAPGIGGRVELEYRKRTSGQP